MNRRAVIIPLETFKTKVENHLCDEEKELDVYEFPERIEKDLEKVMFDFENYEWQGEGFYGKDCCGYKVLKNGVPVLFINAGGDWEKPIVFIIYWSGEEMRAYIPEERNVFDKKYRTAYGSQNETKLWKKEGKTYKDFPEEGEDKQPDFRLMEQNIVNRIQTL